jgi:hypothetical protein
MDSAYGTGSIIHKKPSNRRLGQNKINIFGIILLVTNKA